MTTRDDVLAELAALAHRLDRLVPDYRRPERYFEQRSEIVAALRRLASAAERGDRRPGRGHG